MLINLFCKKSITPTLVEKFVKQDIRNNFVDLPVHFLPFTKKKTKPVLAPRSAPREGQSLMISGKKFNACKMCIPGKHELQRSTKNQFL